MKKIQEPIINHIARLMARTKTEYAIIGGIAVVLYGQPRLTMDVDVNIMLKKGGTANFIKEAKTAGFSPIARNARKFADKTGVIPMKFKKAGGFIERCDFIIAENALEDLAIKRARVIRIGSSRVKVITAEDLVLHKLLSERPRDREDAMGVIARQKNIDMGYIRTWLERIAEITGNKKTVKRIREEMKKSDDQDRL